MSRLTFPTWVAQAQVMYYLPKGTKIYLLDNSKQSISKITFNIGEIETRVVENYTEFVNEIVNPQGEIVRLPYQTNQPDQTDVKYPVSQLYSLNNYIDMMYTTEEKLYHPSKYPENIAFSERTLAAPSANHVNPTGQDLYSAGDKQLTDSGYTFYMDQLVYDAQLKEKVFLKDDKYFLNIASDRISNASSLGTYHEVYDPVGVTIARDSFVPFSQQKTIAENIMKDKMWIKRFADKHYLAVFKSNNVLLNPRLFYAVSLEELRSHFTDDTRY